MAFDAEPGKFLFSSRANVLEAFKDTERWEKIKPAPGAGLFLAGGGRLLFGLSGRSTFRVDDWKIYPEIAEKWKWFAGELEKRGITEKDIENLLTGSISIAFGSEATIQGKRAPGFYIALSGQEGVASKILSKIVDDETVSQAIPLSPLKVEGWDSLFMVDPAISPVSLLLGVSKETFFLGAVDPNALEKKPELVPEADELFKKDLFSSGFFDLAAMWEYLRQEAGDPSSNLGLLFDRVFRNDAVLGELVKDLLSAELAVSSIKLWAPELEKGFLELTLVDVPREKRLLPKMVNLAAAANTRSTSDSEADIISTLRTLKAAALMFYADNVEDVEAGKVDDLINSEGSVEVLLGEYMDFEADEDYFFLTVQLEGNKKWLVGRGLSDKSPGVKERLQGSADPLGLIDEEGNPYAGGDFVFMIVR
jgi:hypothetical protein